MSFERNGQFAIIEFIFLMLLFSSFIYIFISDSHVSVRDYKYIVESALDSIYYSENYRDIIVGEDVGVVELTENWTSLNLTLQSMFNDYEVIIYNNSDSKEIFTCLDDNYSNKDIVERIIAIEDNENYEFRKIRLGVCY